MASSLQLQEGHDLLSQQPFGIRLETAWHPQPADFINLQLGNGHVSVSALCETSAWCGCVLLRLSECVHVCSSVHFQHVCISQKELEMMDDGHELTSKL